MFQGNGNAAIVDRKVDTFQGSIVLLSLQWGTDQIWSNSEDRLEKVSIKTKDLGTGSSGEIGRECVLVAQIYNKFSKCASVYP